MRRLAILALGLVLVPAASAGGTTQADLAVAGARVVAVSDGGFRELTTGGRTVWAPLPTSPRVLESVALAGGAAWVGTTLNGGTGGDLERIELATHARRIVLRVPGGAVLYVAAGVGSVYAFLSVRGPARVVRVALDGRVTGRWNVGDGGRMAADASGCWVAGESGLRHILPDGTLTLIRRVPFGDVAAASGRVWVAGHRELVRVDAGTGRVWTFPTRLTTGGFQHSIALESGALWTLSLSPSQLQRRSADSGRVTRSVRLDGRATAVVPAGRSVWVATTTSIERFDAATLRRTLVVPLF